MFIIADDVNACESPPSSAIIHEGTFDIAVLKCLTHHRP